MAKKRVRRAAPKMTMMQERSAVRSAANPMSYGRVITERSFQRDFRPDLLTKAMEVNGSDLKSAKLIIKIDRNTIKLNGIDIF
jgi:ribosome biogenesis protein Nip4